MISILLSFFFVVWGVDYVFATHLPAEVENADLLKMEKIFSEDTNAISIFRDPVSQNIFIKYTIFSENEDGVREVVREELAVDVPTTKIRPGVQPNLKKLAGGLILYEYQVSNGKDARQPIWYFELVGLQNVRNISSPIMWGAKHSTVKWPHTRWSNLEEPPEVHAIKSGDKLDGFGIEDSRLPAMMKARFIGSPSPSEISLGGFHDEPPATLEKVLNQVLRTDTFQYVYGRTIGPGFEPPTNAAIICDTFILDLIGQVREAVAAGWIKHGLRKDRDDNDGDDSDLSDPDKNLPGVAKSIIKKLTKVRLECLRGKLGSAREKLQALIKQVNAQRGKHLTEEAYALIKFNAEFLLEKL